MKTLATFMVFLVMCALVASARAASTWSTRFRQPAKLAIEMDRHLRAHGASCQLISSRLIQCYAKNVELRVTKVGDHTLLMCGSLFGVGECNRLTTHPGNWA